MRATNSVGTSNWSPTGVVSAGGLLDAVTQMIRFDTDIDIFVAVR